jgi:hypothetical protein
MLLGHGSLPITPMGGKDDLVLVSAMVAARLRAEGGYQAVAPAQALRRFDDLAFANRSRVREFATAARLAGAGLRDTDDQRLRALVHTGIRDGRVVAVRPAAQETDRGASPIAARRRLAATIEARTRGRLAYAGRQYRLVADADLARLPDRDCYEVVRRDLARQVLQALATEPGVTHELAALLAQARAGLTPDWRPPVGAPDGLILLRRARVAAAVAPECEPALTPSQLKALAEAGWIEIEFVDPLGQPVAVACRLELPDSTLVEGKNDEAGLVARYELAPGMCRLSLPDLDAAKWSLQA